MSRRGTTIVRLAKQVECAEGGIKTKMVMYNKADFRCAKMDERPDCVAKPELCDPKKLDVLKTHKLKPVTAPCPKPNARPDHAPPLMTGTPIRICTYQDLLQACPKPCVNPVPQQTFATTLSIFAVKALVASSLVYLSFTLGMWSDGERSEELVEDTKTFFNPPRNTNEMKSSNVSDLERVGFRLRDAYNRTTVMILSTLATIPINVSSMLSRRKPSHGPDQLTLVKQRAGDSKFQNLPQDHGIDLFGLDLDDKDFVEIIN